jgi:hypothetical protein
MRENRQSGSEGGGNEHNRFSLPLSGADGEQAIHRAVGQSFELGDPGGKGREAPGNKRENGSGILFGGSPKKEYWLRKTKMSLFIRTISGSRLWTYHTAGL